MVTDHELILTGPYPYFSAPVIYFGQCTCGTWEASKDSERNIRKRHAQHAEDKEKPKAIDHSNDWDNLYERQLRKL